MVYTKGHAAPWSIHEQRTLLEQFLTGTDWPARSAQMSKEFSDARGRGFFTPNTCQAEFERILQSPCPGHKPLGSASVSYSRKALVDAWIKHLDKEIEKEDSKTFELELVEIRKKSAIIERLMGGSQKPFTREELGDMLADARYNDSKKVVDQHQLCHVVNSYMHRLKEIVEENNMREENISSDLALPSNAAAGDSVVTDIATTMSPARSPLKSPIRPIADVIRENMSPSMEQPISSFTSVDSQVEEDMQMDSNESPTDLPISDDENNSLVPPKSEKKRRGKAKKEPKEEPESVEEEQANPASKGEPSKRKTSRNDLLEETPVEKSPAANRRSSRRGVVDSPLVSGRSKKGRMPESPEPEPEEKKMEDPEVIENIEPAPSVSASEASIPFVPAFIEIGTITEISIQGQLWVHQEKKESRRSVGSRKSARRSEAAAEPVEEKTTSAHREVGVQTKRTEFDKEDKVVVSWNTSERFFVRSVAADSLLKLKEEEWSDDDDIALANLTKKSNAEEEEDEKRGKVDSKKEILVLYDTDEWLARALLSRPNHRLDDGKTSFSPSKRPRKEDKSKEDQHVQTKNLLLNVWRIVCNHKHSGIFSHPVNEKEAPGYSDAIKQRMDLSTLKKEIESGQVASMVQLKMKLNLMFANAVMFNSTGHDVNTYAQEMARETMEEVHRLGNINRNARQSMKRAGYI